MQKYDESHIERHAGLLGIRKRPTPYIGPNDGSGLWTILREPADNAVDQALAGRNDLVHIIVDAHPNRYWLIDNGPGIPVGVKVFENEKGEREKLSTLYVTTGLTHGGSNFSGNTISRGVFGLGLKTTNAMSKVFQVWTFREGAWWTIEYRDARLYKEPYRVKAPPKLPHGIKHNKGTIVMFEPDLKLFQKDTKLQPTEVVSWCQLTSYLVPGMQVFLTNGKGKTRSFIHKRGVLDYIDQKVEELKCNIGKKVFNHNSKLLDVVVAFSDAEGFNVSAYTNGLFNKEGGEHVKALLDALFNSLKPMVKLRGAKAVFPFRKEDLADGLLGLINCKISAPLFSNQPKDKLTDDRVHKPAYDELLKAWNAFWKAHPSTAKELIARASELRKMTASFLKDKRLAKNVNAAKTKLSSKLAPVVGNTPVEKRELILTEGDSASGTLKRARDKRTQAVYPLRGKPLNVMSSKQDKIAANEEIAGLLAAIGVNFNAKDNSKINYGKIIIASDADVDGNHITSLLLGALWKFRPDLFKNGHVYSARPPLFKCRYKGKLYFGMTKEAIWKQTKTQSVDIQYLKGLGELAEGDLYVIADPAHRRLFKVTQPDKKGIANFQALLGPNPLYRKKLLGIL